MLLSYTDMEKDRLNLKHIESQNFCWECILHSAQKGRNTQHLDIFLSILPTDDLEIQKRLLQGHLNWAQSVKHLPWAQVMIQGPRIGSWVGLPIQGGSCFSLCPSHCSHSLSLKNRTEQNKANLRWVFKTCDIKLRMLNSSVLLFTMIYNQDTR